MVKHAKKLLVIVGAVTALAFGGAALSNAAQPSSQPAPNAPAAESPSAPDRDTVQSGDQSAPNSAGSSEQPGSESAAEAPGSETPNDDGSGGHADEPGNANADHQFEGTE
jgi:hypothetical protein